MSYFIFGNDSRQVELSLVVGKEVLTLRNRLSFQSIGQCFIIFTMFPYDCVCVCVNS